MPAPPQRPVEPFPADATLNVSGSTENQGHAAIRELNENFYRSFPDLEVDVLREWGDGQTSAVIEFRARFRDATGQSFGLQGVNVIEIEDGRFRSVRSYEEAPVALADGE